MGKKKFYRNIGRRLPSLFICLILVLSSATITMGSFREPSHQIKENGQQMNSMDNLIHKSLVDDSVIIDIQSSDDIIRLSYQIHDFTRQKVTINDRIYNQIILGKESNIKERGMPDLPNIRRSIVIPDNAKMNIRVIDAQYEEYNNILIAPSKGILSRDVNPVDIAYEFSDFYEEDAWFPEMLAELDDPYILRDYRGQVVNINPFQYNPLQQKLRVYTDLTIEIYPDGVDTVNCITRSELPTKVDTDFMMIYESHFINYDVQLSYTPVAEQGNMLVITYDDFWDEMLPFVQWKNMKGIPIEMVNVSDAGPSANEIQTYISNYYAAEGLTFVLLVGDIGQIPSIMLSGSASDPSYSFIVGDDHYPDLFVGRFSAQNPTQLLTQIERSIEYEKYPQAGADWYHQGTGIGSDEGTGDDGEWDWEHIRNIRTDLLGFTYTWVDEFYGGSQGGEDAPGSPSPADISAALNEGRSIVNFCGHGGWDGWGWGSAPGWYVYHIDDVNTLVNDDMLAFIVSVACSTGAFDSHDTCFGEAWLRTTHNNEPTGAIGFFGSTIDQSWDPPMDAQDEIVDLLVSGQKNTYGGLCFNGCMHMNDEYGPDGYVETDYWTVFGDPSLQVRTDIPASMTVNHDSVIFEGSTEYIVDVPGVADALCALSYNYNLLGYSYTDETGHAVITLDNPIADIETVDLVVTAFNKISYITTPDVVSKRQPAEFEPMRGVLIRYPFGISYDIIREMSEGTEVVTIVTGISEENYVRSEYAAHGVDLNNCSFLHAPTDTYWTRDYGPWFIYTADGEQGVVDFEYNRPRPNDNAIPSVFAAAYGLPLSDLDLVHSGGNYMTDGQGIAVSTELVWTENPGLSHEEIDDRVADILGIQTYHVVPDALGEYIEHIDCWAKYLSPDTIMIIEVPPSHSQYDELEAAVGYFEGQLSCYGTPYEVVRVYTPGGEPYINSLILNDKVFIPITGSSWDDEAITSYQTAMPGYEVLGFTGSWVTTDAIHCRANGIPDRYMLYIQHTPLCDGFPSDDGFLVEARVIPYSGESLIPGSPQIRWKLTDGEWSTVEMQSLGNDRYQAYIPPVPSGETVCYYIQAEDLSGRNESHPYMGAADPHSFDVTPVPDIWINPTSFNLKNHQGATVTEILEIGNEPYAGQELQFDITWTDDSGLGWLSVDPSNGTILPGNSTELDVIATTAGLDIGVYQESIQIASNDPDEPFLIVPVTLNVTLVNDVGAVAINSPSDIILPGSYIVNATIENFGSGNQTDAVVNCSIIEGVIGTFLEEDFSGTFPPAGWSQEQSGEWEQSSTDYAGGTSPEADLYWYDISGDYAYLQSALVDTIGAPVLYLRFKHYVDHYTSSFNCRVLTRSDASDSWADVTPWSNPVTGNIGPEEVTIDVSSDIGTGTQVRFEFDGYYWNLDDWYLDDVEIYSNASRDSGDIVYSAETTISITAYTATYVEFTPPWEALEGTYALRVTTLLPGDQDPSNDQKSTVVTVFIPGDLDFDGDVDLDDLAQLLSNYGTTSGATYEMGDIDGDGDVDLSDLAALLGNYGYRT